MGKELTPKQKAFVEFYCTYRNATKAAREAGYACANQTAHELMKEPGYKHVQDAIAERTADLAKVFASVRNQILDRAVQIAMFNPARVLDDNGQLRPLSEIDPEDASCIASVSRKEFEGGSSTSVKFVNPAPAIKLIFEAAGILKPKQEQEKDYTEEELNEALQTKLDRLLKDSQGEQ